MHNTFLTQLHDTAGDATQGNYAADAKTKTQGLKRCL